MTTIKIEDLNEGYEVNVQEAMDVKGGPGYGASQYQYAFEGTYYNHH